MRRKFLPQRIVAEIPAGFEKISRKQKNAATKTKTPQHRLLSGNFRRIPGDFRRIPADFRRKSGGRKKLKTSSAAVPKTNAANQEEMPQIQKGALFDSRQNFCRNESLGMSVRGGNACSWQQCVRATYLRKVEIHPGATPSFPD